MGINDMSKQENQEKQVVPEGPPWQRAGVFNSFEEADAKRNKIKESSDTEAKVRYRRVTDSYTVHYRKKPKADSAGKKKGKKAKKSKE